MNEDLNQLLTAINANYSEHGSFSVMSDQENIADTGLEYQEGDVVIYYDYSTDEVKPDATQEFIGWMYDQAWPSITSLLENQGFEEVNDVDGSGGGLFYGVKLYRKVQL